MFDVDRHAYVRRASRTHVGVIAPSFDVPLGRTRSVFWACVLALALCAAHPVSAGASGWPLDSAGEVMLEFAAHYTASDGSIATHRGIDIGVPSGSRVLAPAAGKVSFAGRVPGPQGGTVLAATLVTARGTITLLPLETLSVKSGVQVEGGGELGLLASDGDQSSSATHLHVGARLGDMYVNPLTMLSAPLVPAPEAQPQEQPRIAPAPGTAAAPAGSAAGVGVRGAGAGAGVAASAVQVAPAAGSPALAGGPALARAASVAELSSHPVAVPGAELAPGVSVAGAPAVASAGSGNIIEGAARALLGSPTASGAPGLLSGLSAGQLLERAMKLAGRLGRMAGLGLAGALLALGALWPIWRREKRKGLVEISVRPSGDDVAAVAGR